MKKTKSTLIIIFMILISSFIPGIEASNKAEEIWKIQLEKELSEGEEAKILIETKNPEKRYEEIKNYLILDDGKTLIFSHQVLGANKLKLDREYRLLAKKKLTGKKPCIGDSKEDLIYARGVPSRIDRYKKHSWYSYISNDLTDYSLYYMEDEKIKNIYISNEELLDKYKIDRTMNKNDIEKKLGDKKIKRKNTQNEFLIDNLNYKFIYDPFLENKVQGVIISDPKYKNPKIEMDQEVLKIYERQILDLTNLYRAKNNKSSLKYNEELQQLARQYSKYMADNKHFNHYDKEGRNVADRLKEFTNLEHNIVIENLAYGYRTPVAVLEGWIHSETHRMGILHELPEEAGIGIQTDDKTPYYTSIFFRSKKNTRKKASK